MRIRNVFIVVFLTSFWAFAQTGSGDAPPPEVRTAIHTIGPDALRGDLSFISSDLLEGRDSPSRGLDIAADYIAAQFEIAGLEPAVNGTYFQTAHMETVEASFDNFKMTLSRGKDEQEVRPKDAVLRLNSELDLKNAPLFKLDLADSELMDHLTPADIDGKVVIVEFDARRMTRLREASRILRDAKPVLTILLEPKAGRELGQPRHRLEDPEQADNRSRRITLTGVGATRFYSRMKPGLSDAVITAHVEAPIRKQVALRNVIGILRGSDPTLRDTCILLTAHYDHLGIKAGTTGDRIYNGANDDGSGTVSVIAAARALAQLKPHPKRSIVFMTFFGEEEGLIGSAYYAHHPVWPLDKTVAQLNLEQLGRTDSTEGPQISNATLTGFDYSDLTSYVERAGAITGIRVYKDMMNSDPYFEDSDNFSLAEAGVPAETLAVAFDFPDYHAVGDEWKKIDYNNLAKVDRAVALAMYLMAESIRPVRWNDENPKTAPFVKAWDRLQAR